MACWRANPQNPRKTNFLRDDRLHIVTVPNGLRAGQSITVESGGRLERNFAAVSSSIDVSGGEIGENLEVANTEVAITSGSVGDRFNAVLNSQVTVSGGSVGNEFFASSNSRVFVNNGGTIGDQAEIVDGAELQLDGGSIGNNFASGANTQLEVVFGTLGDRARIGGTAEFFDVTVGNNLSTTANGLINIRGGQIGDGLIVSEDGVVNLYEGSVGDDLDIRGTFNLFGGSIGDDAGGGFGGVFNIFGGTVGDGFDASTLSELNIFGGEFGESFRAAFLVDINLHVLDANLDGTNIELLAGEATLIEDQAGLLEATLSDGSIFQLDLGSQSGGSLRLFEATAVPEPTTATLLSLFSLVPLMCRRRKNRI